MKKKTIRQKLYDYVWDLQDKQWALLDIIREMNQCYNFRDGKRRAARFKPSLVKWLKENDGEFPEEFAELLFDGTIYYTDGGGWSRSWVRKDDDKWSYGTF